MHPRTRQQLHALSLAFYEAHAEAFDVSRSDLPWPGWDEVLRLLPQGRISVLDIGCGNGRFARYLRAARISAMSRPDQDSGETRAFDFDYVGTDANAALLEAARARLGTDVADRCDWRLHDFLASPVPGADLPSGPFSLVILMGVLHHVPGSDTRLAVLRAAADRLEPDGLLAFTTWQFEARPRFDRRRVEWRSIGPVLGEPIDPDELEPGDHLLRFGDDPNSPPRYCHQVSGEEFGRWAEALGLEPVADFRADGAQGDLNRYGILRRP